MGVSLSAETYIVTGSDATLFGSQWDEHSSCVCEQQADGSYAWSKTDVTLAAGKIEYKFLTLEAGWGEGGWQLPQSGNLEYTIEQSGVYDITCTLSADLTTGSMTATLKGEADVHPEIIMHGQFYGDWANTDAFTYNSNYSAAKLTLSGIGGSQTIEFGLKINNVWKANGAEITKDNNSTDLSQGAESNMKFITAETGDYTFIYTVASQNLLVIYPGMPIPDIEEGIINTEAAVKVNKIIRNGQVLIVRGDVCYDMMGQEVKK